MKKPGTAGLLLFFVEQNNNDLNKNLRSKNAYSKSSDLKGIPDGKSVFAFLPKTSSSR